MGYYTGAGVTSAGSSTVQPFQHYLWNGSHTVYQKRTAVTNRKSGVSLANAQSQTGDCNLTSNQFWIGSSWYWAFNCKGTQKNVQYSQIGGSNLYDLVVVNETIQARIDNQGWVS